MSIAKIVSLRPPRWWISSLYRPFVRDYCSQDTSHKAGICKTEKERMDSREDLKSIHAFLPPVVVHSSSLHWPSEVEEALKAMSKGPQHSKVNSGKILFNSISDIRHTLSLSAQHLSPSASQGYAYYFQEIISQADSEKWFAEVVPALANLLLRFPSLLESHYQSADDLLNEGKYGCKTGLRLLGPQEAGMVLLSQELIGALLACSFFCLFPVKNRTTKHLRHINFDKLFASLYDSYSEQQENKIKCILHYFERICSWMPTGFVSFERKVLPLEHHLQCVSYPKANFWSKSVIPLCPFKVHSSGLIEDQLDKALEVDFADKYIGGLALGCVQEEIRFMINPELIAGMLFLTRMADNEAIEIVGAERFSDYTGYASSFRFSGDHVDEKIVDSFGRHKTRIIDMDMLRRPGLQQYTLKCLLREINKAFCGFFDQSKYGQYERLFQDNGFCGAQLDQEDKDPNAISKNSLLLKEAHSTSAETDKRESVNQVGRNSGEECSQFLDHEGNIGIATGNWGCGDFGGDPNIRAILQWLAASQALRPFCSYYTFGNEKLKTLDQVSQWILLQEWTVGDLWNKLVEYSLQRSMKKTDLGFFTWLRPSSTTHKAAVSYIIASHQLEVGQMVMNCNSSQATQGARRGAKSGEKKKKARR